MNHIIGKTKNNAIMNILRNLNKLFYVFLILLKQLNKRKEKKLTCMNCQNFYVLIQKLCYYDQ